MYSCAGEGQFGKVYACVNLDTGELMAVKQVRKCSTIHRIVLFTFSTTGSNIEILTAFLCKYIMLNFVFLDQVSAK